MSSRICQALLIVAIAAPATAVAQQVTTPPEWRWILDRPAILIAGDAVADSAWSFVRMPPGFHVTTGPGVLLYAPAEGASGHYSLASRFAVFPNPSDQGYGIFLGGTQFETGFPQYLAILLRRDGAVSVTAREGATTRTLHPWTSHPAIKPHPGTGVVTNAMRVSVAPDSLRVFINDSAVVALPRAGLPTAGAFGLRVGEAINVHITILDHTRHLAPVPVPRP